MTEQLALAQKVERAAVVDELDGAAADDPNTLRRLLSLLEDDLAVGEELDLDGTGDGIELRLVEIDERLVLAEEVGDVVHGEALAIGAQRDCRLPSPTD